MRKTSFVTALVMALVAAALSTGAAAAKDRKVEAEQGARIISVSTRSGAVSQHVTMGLNKAVIVQLDADARDVLVSSPDIVDAVVRTPRRVFLLGNKTGQTNAFFFDGAGHQLLSLEIRVERDTGDLASMVRAAAPGSNVKVESMNDNVVLSGTVSSAQDVKHVQDLAARFAGDPAKVVNMISIGGSEQVMLKVRVAEMSRTISKQFGINISGSGSIGDVAVAGATSNPYSLIGRALSDLSGASVGGPNNPVQGKLNALEEVGLVHILAEPNLTAVSGETAKFLAGGSFPVPTGRDRDGNVTIEFKDFGVGLSFTPVVLSAGRLSLQVSTEVSELTNTGAFTLTGTSTTGLTIPALAVRRAETTVELPSGGTFAVAGLMQHTSKQQLDAFPGLKDMPILGALFRSRDYQNNETELVVMITAYLVKPTTEAALSAPTDGFVAPSDLDTILLGKLNTVYKKKPDATQAQSLAQGKAGYILP